MKTFDDLIFKEDVIPGFGTKVSSKTTLDNGVIVSVIGGVGCYGDGVTSFEIAAWRDEVPGFIKLCEFDDVMGWLSKEQITKKMIELSKM